MQNSRASMHRVVDVLNILGSRHRVVLYLSDQRRNGDRLHVLQGRLLGQMEPRALVNGPIALLVAVVHSQTFDELPDCARARDPRQLERC